MSAENDHSTIDHSALLVACALLVLLLPRSFHVWPFPLLVPILAYFVFVAAVPYLRRSFRSPPLGGRRVSSWLFAVVVAAAASGVLFWFQQSQQPDLQYLHDVLPVGKLGWVAVALIFPLVNAVLEEIVFRWILFDGFRARWGVGVAVVGSSLLFGFGHLGGYPPGMFGGILATVYGLSLAILRLHSRGLIVPVATHLLADATILAILYRWTPELMSM